MIEAVAGATARENVAQRQVIEHGSGPVRVMAGAGTGKTYTLTQRIVQLVREKRCRPDQILALSFNTKSAAEMRDRITEALVEVMPADAEPPAVMTYHSFGSAIIGEWGGLIGMPPRPQLLSKAGQWLLLWDCLPRVDFRSINLLALRGEHGSPMGKMTALAGRLGDELSTPADLLRFLDGASADDSV